MKPVRARTPPRKPGRPTRGWSLPRPPRSDADPAALAAETHGRVKYLAGGLGLFIGALVLRSSWLMLVADERLEQRADEQFQATVEVKGRRGDLVDRRGRILAMEVRLPALYANPSKLVGPELEAVLPALAALTGAEPEALRERFAVTVNGRLRKEIKLGDRLDPDAVTALVKDYPADVLWKRDESVRVWPGRDLGSSLIGFVGDGDVRQGLERVLNRELEGDTYKMMRDRDRRGRRVRAGADDARLANAGQSVQLSLDLAIQQATEDALQKAMTVSAPEAAMAVVMDVRTGGILAMASLPGGNANDGRARADLSLFKNRAAMDQIEPGSVFKPFIVAGAIEEGLVTPDTMIDCELGRWGVDDRVIKDDHAKGVISVREVIKYSSNIGTAKIGFKLGNHRMVDYLRQFGFGRETGLRLPGESRGIIRNPDTARAIEMATTAFGQGVTASPIQLVAGTAALANGGVRMRPRLVDAILGRDGAVEERREPVVDKQVISEATARVVGDMMVGVTEEGGTGTRARVKGYLVAGKTGTAQKVENGVYSSARISSFVGFLPADRPEVAIAVIIDSPTLGSKYGGIAAAPAWAEIGEFVMKYLAIPPDPSVAGPEIVPWNAPARPEPVAVVTTPAPEGPLELVATTGGWVVPDLRGRALRSVLATFGPAGVPVTFTGSGRVAAQTPAPGSHLPTGLPVTVSLN